MKSFLRGFFTTLAVLAVGIGLFVTMLLLFGCASPDKVYRSPELYKELNR